MHKLYFFILIISFGLCLNMNAQTPEKINYQSIIRNSEGEIMSSTALVVRIEILESLNNPQTIYSEQHTTSTDENGIVTLHIGAGDSNEDFSDIDWSMGNLFVESSYNFQDGQGFQLSSTAPLLSVPYSLLAKNVENESDPVFSSSVAQGISQADTASWNDNLSSTDLIWEANNENAYFPNSLLIGDSLLNINNGTKISIVQNADSTGGYPISSYNIAPTGQTGMVNWIYDKNQNKNDGWAKFTTNNKGAQGYIFGIPKAGTTEIFSNRGGGHIAIGTGSDDPTDVVFGTHGLQRMIINDNGNIGIGTTNPTSKFSVANGDLNIKAGGIQLDKLLEIRDHNSNDHINTYENDIDAPIFYTRYFYGEYGDLIIQGLSKTYTGNIQFVTGSTVSTDDPPTQRMIIMDDGNVGVGNFWGDAFGQASNPERPRAKLQVKDGDVYLDTIGNGVITRSPNGNCWRLTVDNSGNIITTAISCP